MDRHYFQKLFKKNASVLILGAGKSGIAAAHLCLEKNLNVLLFDDKKKVDLHDFDESARKHSLHFTSSCGELALPLETVDAVIVSPGVPLTHPLVRKAHQKAKPVLSEIDLAALYLPAPLKVIGVTGTNGKSTTTVMIENILKLSGKKAVACGNLGIPLSRIVLEIQKNAVDYLVVELSSFQLETTLHLSLECAVILNITPDHLDRHPSFESYRQAKWKIASLLLHETGLIVHDSLKNQAPKNARYFSGDYWQLEEFKKLYPKNIFGAHNLENAMAAFMAARTLAIPQEAIVKGLETFHPLPHRCESIGKKQGIHFINDSKGTTVEAVKKALSMHDAPTHLLLGGIEKGENFSSLNPDSFPHIKGYYVYGQAAKKILSELNHSSSHPCPDLASAFSKALSNAKSGEIILLSPGCASFDQFTDYQHRGETFKKLVKEL